LALGFIPAGLTKIMGERFASGLSVLHPMGSYLEVLHHTSYYYTFIGVVQVLAAVLLLIPRTALLGALMYFPIILNICILSFAVRFDGSFVSAPLMVLANLYILFWYFDRLKFVLPFKTKTRYTILEKPKKYTNEFPIKFFSGVVLTIGLMIVLFIYGYEVMPKNSLSECEKQFKSSEKQVIGFDFCKCIHTEGKSLDTCLKVFDDKTD
jgi:uncharacterized membrane protein YphA (DoxX/SURF4 family)